MPRSTPGSARCPGTFAARPCRRRRQQPGRPRPTASGSLSHHCGCASTSPEGPLWVAAGGADPVSTSHSPVGRCFFSLPLANIFPRPPLHFQVRFFLIRHSRVRGHHRSFSHFSDSCEYLGPGDSRVNPTTLLASVIENAAALPQPATAVPDPRCWFAGPRSAPGSRRRTASPCAVSPLSASSFFRLFPSSYLADSPPSLPLVASFSTARFPALRMLELWAFVRGPLCLPTPRGPGARLDLPPEPGCRRCGDAVHGADACAARRGLATRDPATACVAIALTMAAVGWRLGPLVGWPRARRDWSEPGGRGSALASLAVLGGRSTNGRSTPPTHRRQCGFIAGRFSLRLGSMLSTSPRRVLSSPTTLLISALLLPRIAWAIPTFFSADALPAFHDRLGYSLRHPVGGKNCGPVWLSTSLATCSTSSMPRLDRLYPDPVRKSLKGVDSARAVKTTCAC